MMVDVATACEWTGQGRSYDASDRLSFPPPLRASHRLEEGNLDTAVDATCTISSSGARRANGEQLSPKANPRSSLETISCTLSQLHTPPSDIIVVSLMVSANNHLTSNKACHELCQYEPLANLGKELLHVEEQAAATPFNVPTSRRYPYHLRCCTTLRPAPAVDIACRMRGSKVIHMV